jgi:tetratricopeptide (TPR) repeat protein
MKAAALASVAALTVAGCVMGPSVIAQSIPQQERPIPAAGSQAPPVTPQSKPAGAQQQAQKPIEAVSPPAPPMTPAEREEMRGDIFMARKMYAEAIQTYTDLLLADQKNARLLNKVGICYHQLGDLGRAERYYKKAAKADKHFASPLNNLGAVAFAKRKYKRAVKEYKKAIKVDPTVPTTFSNLGYAYLARKKVKDAILAFRQAILLDPLIFQNRGNLGSVVEQGGTMERGLFYYTLAKTFAMLGNAERCAHYLKMSRDEGYKKFTEARKDPAFKPVLKDPRVQMILAPPRTDTAQIH